MGIFDGVMLVSDYDGTLRGNNGVLRRDINAIKYFQKEGGLFFMCTGRCWATFTKQAEELPLTMPALLSNGACLCRMDTGEVLFSHGMPECAPKHMTVLAELFPKLAMECYYGEEVYCCHPNEYTEWHSHLTQSSYIELMPEEMPSPWLKVMFEADNDTLQKVRTYILTRWGETYECIFSYDTLLELTAKGVHKGSGVLTAAEQFGIAREHIYCVGDNDNDYPMLQVANIGFAPKGSVIESRGYPGIQIVEDCDSGCIESVVRVLEMSYTGKSAGNS